MHLSVRYTSKAQMQIQQLAFVLVALVIFVGIVALFFISTSISRLSSEARGLESEAAEELARHLSSLPEFSWGAPRCAHCIDLDKVFVLREQLRGDYKGLLPMRYVAIERLYPPHTKRVCTSLNYPDCSTIELVGNNSVNGTSRGAFVSICHYEGGGTICELGKVYITG